MMHLLRCQGCVEHYVEVQLHKKLLQHIDLLSLFICFFSIDNFLVNNIYFFRDKLEAICLHQAW